MSTYYLLVNYDKKEWLDSGDIGRGRKDITYEIRVTPLLGYLMFNQYHFDFKNKDRQYNPNLDITDAQDETKRNFTFSGHWVGDRVKLISEYDELYETVSGYGPHADEAKLWVNISRPLASEWNHNIKYWYGESPDMQEWIKQHTYVWKEK